MHLGEIDLLESVKASVFWKIALAIARKQEIKTHLEVKKVPAFLKPNLEHKLPE